jgi:hypothetical protein
MQGTTALTRTWRCMGAHLWQNPNHYRKVAMDGKLSNRTSYSGCGVTLNPRECKRSPIRGPPYRSGELSPSIPATKRLPAVMFNLLISQRWRFCRLRGADARLTCTQRRLAPQSSRRHCSHTRRSSSVSLTTTSLKPGRELADEHITGLHCGDNKTVPSGPYAGERVDNLPRFATGFVLALLMSGMTESL